jgi:hypothetical protein
MTISGNGQLRMCSPARQAEIIGTLGQPNETTGDLSTEIAQKVAALLKGR